MKQVDRSRLSPLATRLATSSRDFVSRLRLATSSLVAKQYRQKVVDLWQVYIASTQENHPAHLYSIFAGTYDTPAEWSHSFWEVRERDVESVEKRWAASQARQPRLKRRWVPEMSVATFLPNHYRETKMIKIYTTASTMTEWRNEAKPSAFIPRYRTDLVGLNYF